MLIILDSTSRTLKAVMSMNATTTNCTAVVAYADNNGTTFTEGSTPTSLNGMTAVTILAAPASGVRRIVKSICIYNPDTETHTTTLIFNDNTTEYPITRLTLAPGASWSSDDQTGVNVGGAVTDGSKGDIDVSGGGTTWTINNDAVTYAKIQNVTDARLIGRSAGSIGDAQEISVGTGLSLSTGATPTLTASGVSDGDKGDITVSSSGATWTVDNGVITYAKIQNVTDARLLGRSSGTAGSTQEITVGSGLSLSQGATPTLTATGGSMVYPGAGIAVSNGTAWITPKNSPTGDVVGTSDSQTLTNKTINGANNTISNINLTSQVTGTLPVANGGTGTTSLTANNVVLGNGTSALQVVAPGTTGNVLTSNGTTWVSSAAGGGDSLSNSAITPTTNETAASSTRYAVNLSSLSADIDFILPTPSAANEVIEVSISIGNSDYEMFIRPATGAVTINGGRYAAQSVTASTADTITLTAHPLLANDPVSFSFTSGGSMPGGLTQNTIYYVRDVTTNTFKVATTRGGSAVDITSTGSNVTVTRQEWTRLFIPGETLEFRSTSTTNWSITKDGRIPNICRLGRTSAQTISHNTSTIIRVDTVTYDNANMNQIGVTIGGAAADGIRLRRPGRYLLTCGIRLTTISATINQFSAWMTDTLNIIHQFGQQYAPSGNAPGHALVAANEFIADVTIYMRAQHNSGVGTTQDTSANPYPHLSVTEILG